MRANLGLFGLTEADLAEYETINTIYSDVSGVTYVAPVRRERGISDVLIRLSVGIEDARDLVRDLAQALETVRTEATVA